MIFTSSQHNESIKVGVAGVGAIGSAVCKALMQGIEGLTLHGYSDPSPNINISASSMDHDTLIKSCDLVIECLPPLEAQRFATQCLDAERDLIMISACALLSAPDLLNQAQTSKSRLIVPSGALAGIDGVSALFHLGIKSASIASTKKPSAYDGAPFIIQNEIDLSAITNKTKLFSGNALEAAQGFPANLNVAATLSLAGIGPERTQVEIWADPAIKGNRHDVTVQSDYSTLRTSIENMPDPSNPKSSMLAAQSIVAVLNNMTAPLVVL